MQVVRGYNEDPAVHGILVQLPMPAHINEQRVLDAISGDKDVDGFGPDNIGRLAMRGREPAFVACTPKVRLIFSAGSYAPKPDDPIIPGALRTASSNRKRFSFPRGPML